VKGKKFGYNHTQNPNAKAKPRPVSSGGGAGGGQGDANTGRQQLGGGKGDLGDTGGVADGGKPGEPQRPQRIFTNPKEPGATLIADGEGTVAIRDANGEMTPRQRYDIKLFAKFGWKVDSSAGGTGQAAGKAAGGTGKGDSKVRSARSSAAAPGTPRK